VKGCCERDNEPSGSIQYWEVLEWLHNWQLLKKGSAPWVSWHWRLLSFRTWRHVVWQIVANVSEERATDIFSSHRIFSYISRGTVPYFEKQIFLDQQNRWVAATESWISTWSGYRISLSYLFVVFASLSSLMAGLCHLITTTAFIEVHVYSLFMNIRNFLVLWLCDLYDFYNSLEFAWSWTTTFQCHTRMRLYNNRSWSNVVN
jgi:hypothetical protein